MLILLVMIIKFFDKLITSRYDFLIVVAAGNDNCNNYLRIDINNDANNKYGYRKCFENETPTVYVKNDNEEYE